MQIWIWDVQLNFVPLYNLKNVKNTHREVFLNWDSLHARLNSHYKALSYKKKKYEKIKAYRKSL